MHNTYIALSKLPDDFCINGETVLITNGCSLDYKNINYLMKTNIFNNDSIKKKYNKSILLSIDIIQYIASILSKKYNINLQFSFWRKLLYPWALHFIQALIYRDEYIKNSLHIVNNPIYITDNKDYYTYMPSWYNMSISLFSDDIFNLHLLSDIVRFYKLNSKTFFNITRNNEMKIKFGNVCSHKYSLILDELYKNGIESNKPVHVLYGCYGISDGFQFLRNGFARLTLAGNYSKIISLPNLDVELRNTVIHLHHKDTFSQLLGTIALRYLPVCYCEALPGLLEWARSIKLPHNGVLATSVSHFIDPLFAVLAAVSDIPFVVIEHGGGQMYRHFTSYDLSGSIADRYYDWGNASPYYLPNPYLTKIYPRNKLKPPLLVCACIWRYPSMLHSANSIDACDYFSERTNFLRLIAPLKRPEVRLYIREYGWAERRLLDSELPGISYQSAMNLPIEQAIADSILLVHDHYSTTFHRAMATDIPSIVFTKPGLYSEKGESMISMLRECGIWHDTAESAARFYMSLVEKSSTWREAEINIQDWWNEASVRKAREEFCMKYAQTDVYWAKKWQSAFDIIC